MVQDPVRSMLLAWPTVFFAPGMLGRLEQVSDQYLARNSQHPGYYSATEHWGCCARSWQGAVH
jgi:hypothetical protein